MSGYSKKKKKNPEKTEEKKREKSVNLQNYSYSAHWGRARRKRKWEEGREEKEEEKKEEEKDEETNMNQKKTWYSLSLFFHLIT